MQNQYAHFFNIEIQLIIPISIVLHLDDESDISLQLAALVQTMLTYCNTCICNSMHSYGKLKRLIESQLLTSWFMKKKIWNDNFKSEWKAFVWLRSIEIYGISGFFRTKRNKIPSHCGFLYTIAAVVSSSSSIVQWHQYFAATAVLCSILQ